MVQDKIKICIVDDHPIFRDGLIHILNSDINIEVTEQVGTAKELFEVLEQSESNFLILDLSLPDMSGIEVLGQLKSKEFFIPTLVLTMFSDKHYVIRALEAGALGFLTKDKTSKYLIQAVKSVAKGEKYISPELEEKLQKNLEGNELILSHKRLSKREFEVFVLLAKGYEVHSIANQLDINSKTISTYKIRIMKKLELTSIGEIVRYAIDNNIVE